MASFLACGSADEQVYPRGLCRRMYTLSGSERVLPLYVTLSVPGTTRSAGLGIFMPFTDTPPSRISCSQARREPRPAFARKCASFNDDGCFAIERLVA